MRPHTALLTLASLASVALAACERPPPNSQQTGYRGLGMVQVTNPRTDAAKLAVASKLPDVQPKADPGKKASEVYKSLKVLGDLNENELVRVMAAVTEWVAPEQGCAYCHNTENLADESLYTHAVARRMFQMTRSINEQWKPHVGQTGVTCYTCHAGKPVPQNIWFKSQPETNPAVMAGYTAGGQNKANASVGLTSMVADPFSALANQKGEVRVIGPTALPTGHTASIQSTEATYALMIHMSEGLGVNCTFCHNTRSFANWDSSTPQRVTAWHGLRLVRDLNATYLDPLKPAYPAERLGPEGDAPKAYCTTCHQGLAKPLNGAPMLKDYQELLRAATAPVPLPATVKVPKL